MTTVSGERSEPIVRSPRRRAVAAPRRVAGPRLGASVAGLLLVLIPSVVTVLRDTATNLNADGVEQSFMSVQGVSLFYWGQDRLVPVVSFLASPVADPTANLWTCLVLQSMCFYGLLLFIAHRAASAIGSAGFGSTVICYLALVACANCLFSTEMMQVFAIEGQPYALSWLLLGLSYEAWKTGGHVLTVASVPAAFVAMGVNPSVLLLGVFLAVTAVLRSRRLLRWVVFVGVLGVCFVAWSYLSQRYAMYPTPAKTAEPDYLGFSLGAFRGGLSASITDVIVELQPVRTVTVVLGALLAMAVLRPPVKSALATYGTFFIGFTLFYVALFAGNQWVLLNGFPFRYFFPLPLALVMLTAIPIAAAFLQLAEAGVPGIPGFWLMPVAGLVGVVCIVVSLVGPIREPQHSEVFRDTAKTQAFATRHNVHFVAGAYWNTGPLALGLLDTGRDNVLVAGFKSGGDRADYRRVLDEQVAEGGVANAMCINQTVEVCTYYLSYWTRPGWTPVGKSCPAPPPIAPADTSGVTSRMCTVLRYHGPR